MHGIKEKSPPAKSSSMLACLLGPPVLIHCTAYSRLLSTWNPGVYFTDTLSLMHTANLTFCNSVWHFCFSFLVLHILVWEFMKGGYRTQILYFSIKYTCSSEYSDTCINLDWGCWDLINQIFMQWNSLGYIWMWNKLYALFRGKTFYNYTAGPCTFRDFSLFLW